MKLADLTLDELPTEPTDEPDPQPIPKRRSGSSRFNPAYQVQKHAAWKEAQKERVQARPAWMSDSSLLPRRPPGK